MEKINLIFKHTKTKNIRISVKQDLQVVVSFPKKYSQKKAEEFLHSKMDWVKNSLEKMKKRQQIRKNYISKETVDLRPEEIRDRKHYLILRCKELAKLHNFKIRKITLRKQKSIWGSCSRINNISLNVNLIYLKDDLIDYVILHELAHTIVKNHSKTFWNELKKILPNYHDLDRKLKLYMPDLVIDH